MKIRGMFLDVRGEVYEVVVDEGRSFVVAIRFGFQPNAAASSGRGAEVNEHRLLTGFCFGQGSVCIFHPVYFHVLLSFGKSLWRGYTAHQRTRATFAKRI
jgi:hypothetical protein